MTSASTTRSIPPVDDHRHLRLRLKPRAPVTGFVDVLSADHCVTSLVVPPEAAHGSLMAAGRRANTDRIDALLSAGNADSADDADEVAQQRWDLDGGPVRLRASGGPLVRASGS